VDPAALGRVLLNSITFARVRLLKTAPNAYITELSCKHPAEGGRVHVDFSA